LAAAVLHTSGPVPQVKAAATRSLEIATRLGNRTFQARALWALQQQHYMRGEYHGALTFSERMNKLALQGGAVEPFTDRFMSLTLHLVGRHAEAREHGERALELSATSKRSLHSRFFQYEVQVAARTQLSRIMWVHGFPDRAVALADEGLERTLALDYAPQVCTSIIFSTFPIAFWTGDIAAARRYANLLQDWFQDLAAGCWQSWTRCYKMLAELTADDGSAAFRNIVASLRTMASVPVCGDILPALREELVVPEAIARAENGQAG
jgi:hypothetical protein